MVKVAGVLDFTILTSAASNIRAVFICIGIGTDVTGLYMIHVIGLLGLIAVAILVHLTLSGNVLLEVMTLLVVGNAKRRIVLYNVVLVSHAFPLQGTVGVKWSI